ncbi:hypothetical protein GOODEAATRI_005606 [Goodea atripinnis]|uniref:Uncharacterized protein n=1 Tax=Goodea atripinnis TaxID=208336 RepID=A0ABV0NHS4_9TELE
MLKSFGQVISTRILRDANGTSRGGGMTLAYDPTALQNGMFCLFNSFYSSPYSLAPNRMIAQTSLSPYMHSPVSSYQPTLLCRGPISPSTPQCLPPMFQ